MKSRIRMFLPSLVRYFIFLSFLFFSSIVLGNNFDKSFYSIHQEYIGLRPLGMGNAFVAVADDYNSLFYNPSGLSNIKESRINISIMQVGLTTGKNSIIDLYGDIKGMSNKEGDSKTTEMADYIQARYGRNYYARINPISFFWTSPNKGFAIIPMDFSLNLGLHQQVGPTLKVLALEDSTMAFGYGRRLEKIPHLALGATFKAMYRTYFGKIIPALELASDNSFIKKSDAKEGGTLDLDIGALYDWPYDTDFKPTFAMTIRNLIDNGFRKNYHLLGEFSARPPDLERRLDIGLKFSIQKVGPFSPSFAMDERDIGHTNFTFLKGLCLGTEWKWEYEWWLKGSLLAGLKQGYPTLGISLQSLWFLLELVNYGDEIGTKSLRKQNRISMGKLSFYF